MSIEDKALKLMKKDCTLSPEEALRQVEYNIYCEEQYTLEALE